MTTFSDAFTRADSTTIGNGWVEVSEDWTLASNRLAAPTGGGTGVLRCGTPMATNDHSAQVTLAVTAAASMGVGCRADASFANGYLWRNDGTSWDLFSVVGGSFTGLATFAGAAANGDVAKVQAVGSTIKGFVNGVERASVTDTNIPTGLNTVIRSGSSATVRYDDFTAADVGGGGTVNGTIDATLGGLSATATAVREVAGAIGATMGGLSASVSGVREVAGAVSFTGGALSAHATSEAAGLLHPSDAMVMLAWLQQVLGLSYSARTLPHPRGWFDTGFITVPGVVGGDSEIYVPERKPVLQVNSWAANRSGAGKDTVSRKPPWGMANQLMDRIVLGTYPTPVPEVTLDPAFLPVWIETVFPVSSVRRTPELETGIAGFSVDIALHWIERNPVI